MLPETFPGKEKLEKEGYHSVEDVSEATDEEILSIDGIAEGTLAKIRELAPFKPSPEEQGTGATSGAPARDTTQSVLTQTGGLAKRQVNPVTGEELPVGVSINDRGTFTATSSAAGLVTPEQVEAQKRNLLTSARNRLSAIFEE